MWMRVGVKMLGQLRMAPWGACSKENYWYCLDGTHTTNTSGKSVSEGAKDKVRLISKMKVLCDKK